MATKTEERQRAKAALASIIPIIEKCGFKWVITGGFILPLLSKQAVIDNKEMLTQKDKWQIRDIEELSKLL